MKHVKPLPVFLEDGSVAPGLEELGYILDHKIEMASGGRSSVICKKFSDKYPEILDFYPSPKTTHDVLVNATVHLVNKKTIPTDDPDVSHLIPVFTPNYGSSSDQRVTFDLVYRRMLHLLNDLEPSSTPGFPLSEHFSKNRDVVSQIGPEIAYEAARQYYYVLQQKELPDCPLESFLAGAGYFVTTHIKNEPVPLRKKLVGRWRTVNALNLVQQLVERYLFTDVKAKIKESFPNNSIVIGVDFTDDGSTKMCNRLAKMSGLSPDGKTSKYDVFCNDISSFESSLHPSYVFCFARDVSNKVTQFPGETYNGFKLALKNWALRMTNIMYAFPSKGCVKIYRALERGRTVSGGLVTNDLNGYSRAKLAKSCGAEDSSCVGDDCVEVHEKTGDTEAKKQAIIAKARSLGFNMRECEILPPGLFKYCSHESDYNNEYKSILSSWYRGVWKAMSNKVPNVEGMASLMFEMRHQPEVLKDVCEMLFEPFCKAHGVEMPIPMKLENTDSA